MKAILCKQFGGPESLVLEEVPSPKINDRQVLIQVKACGVNFPDLLIIQGQYQFKPSLPFSPGGEIAGIVKQVGAKVKHVKEGDAVFAPTIYGGYAEEVAVEGSFVMPIPAGMDFVTASSFIINYATTYHALKDRARIHRGETMLVLGAAGGVGITAVELGKIMGLRVIAAASTDDKLALCRQYGADETINYNKEILKEKILSLTNRRGVDLVYDPVGGGMAEQALRGMAWKGRYLVIGFAAGDIPKIPLNLPLLKVCDIVGVFWGAFAQNEPESNAQNLRELVQLYQEGKLKPYIHATYPLDRASHALQEVRDRKVRGKIVLTDR